MSTVTYDDDGNAQRAWWVNTDDGCETGWYENGRFSLHITWREWAIGFQIPEPREEYDRQFVGLYVGPLRLYWETTR